MREIHYDKTYRYGELAQALASLEFNESSGHTDLGIAYRAFYNKAHGALVLLPNMADTELLEPVHLRTAEKAVEDFGVADSKTFFRLLRKAEEKAA